AEATVLFPILLQNHLAVFLRQALGLSDAAVVQLDTHETRQRGAEEQPMRIDGTRRRDRAFDVLAGSREFTARVEVGTELRLRIGSEFGIERSASALERGDGLLELRAGRPVIANGREKLREFLAAIGGEGVILAAGLFEGGDRSRQHFTRRAEIALH